MSRNDYEDEDDRPRRKSKKKPKRRGPNPLIWVGLAAAAIAIAVGGFFVIRGLSNKPTDAKGNPIAGGGALPPAAKTGVKYVPRESEKKLGEFLKTIGERRATEAEIFAIMGEPTRVDAPETVVKNGQRLTFYEAYWEVPGSGVSSSIMFVNGVESGMVLGLEVTPRK